MEEDAGCVSRVPILPFQELIVQELNRDDHLCLLASGLCWQKLLAVFLRAHTHAVDNGDMKGALVILGAAPWQRQLLIKEILRHHPDSELPMDITNEVPMSERVEQYQQGRCCFITTRIFVVDLLAARVAPKNLCGIVILNVHKVTDTSGEGFAVRIYRRGNKTGFIRGFSDQPISFSSGFAKVEKVMKALHIRKLSLWPRFHSVVRDDLEKNPIEVVEVCQELSLSMGLIQDAITATIAALIKELKRTNKVDCSELNVENGIFKSFDDIVQRQLNPIWHMVSWKTKQIITDLRQLRKLSTYLLRYDCVTFLRFLEHVRSEGSQSVWLFHNASHTIFEQAKRRVYILSAHTCENSAKNAQGSSHGARGGHGKGKKKRKQPGASAASVAMSTALGSSTLTAKPVLEELPKWNALREILQEIQQEFAFDTFPLGQKNARPQILVMCKELYMCKQLLHAVIDGNAFLRKMFRGYVIAKQENKEKRTNERIWKSKRPNDVQAALAEGGAGTTDIENEALARFVLSESNTSAPPDSLPGDEEKRAKHLKPAGAQQPNLDFQPQEVEDCGPAEICPELAGVHFLSLDSQNPFLLWELEPQYVIMYDLDVEFLRQLEVFKAEVPNRYLKLYLLSYKDSLEQHKYKSAVQKEIEVFADLIENKGRITIPLDLGATQNSGELLDDNINMQAGVGQGSTVGNNALTRRAGGRKIQKPQSHTVVVDMREFMSHLPAVLYEKGFKIHPITLEVGDYILSPEIVVERKSLPDLFGSFISGRLYHQAELMSRNYKIPVLLIEFEQDKQFCLQSNSEIGQDIAPNNIISKLVLLTLHFPKLRIVWSRSLHATSSIFLSLKSNQEEPDPHLAASIASVPGNSAESGEVGVNHQAVEILRKLPGVTDGNFRLILGACSCLADLADMTLEQLEQVMGSKRNAKVLRDFLHAPSPRHLAL